MRTSKSVMRGLQRRQEVFSIYSNGKTWHHQSRFSVNHSSLSNRRSRQPRPKSNTRSLSDSHTNPAVKNNTTTCHGNQYMSNQMSSDGVGEGSGQIMPQNAYESVNDHDVHNKR